MNRKLLHLVHFVAVSLYLSFVGLFLIITRRVETGVSLPHATLRLIFKKVAKIMRKRASGTLLNISPEVGSCFISPIPSWIVSDSNGHSELKLFENGKPLGPAHAVHDDIRSFGGGRYSHWGHYIYFSTSDNSDPRTNGRTYSFSAR